MLCTDRSVQDRNVWLSHESALGAVHGDAGDTDRDIRSSLFNARYPSPNAGEAMSGKAPECR
ncbi:hypothetical protein GCM10009619_41890 [Williamsia maris]